MYATLYTKHIADKWVDERERERVRDRETERQIETEKRQREIHSSALEWPVSVTFA